MHSRCYGRNERTFSQSFQQNQHCEQWDGCYEKQAASPISISDTEGNQKSFETDQSQFQEVGKKKRRTRKKKKNNQDSAVQSAAPVAI